MKLKEYLIETGIKKYVFAENVGVTGVTLRSILSGSKDIHLGLACRIEDLTNGKVTCRDLVNPFYIKQHERKAREIRAREIK